MSGVANNAVLALARTRARLHRSDRVLIEQDVLVFGRPIVAAVPGSRIVLRRGVRLVSTSRRTPLGVNHPVVLRTLRPGATITVGAGTGLSGATVCAAAEVTIGAGCLLGANVTVVDTDFHPVHSADRATAPLPEPQPGERVVIGDNVFLGTGCIVLKGVTVGADCVIGAGAVVTTDCEPGTIVAGNPARVVGTVRVGPGLRKA